MNNRNYLNAQHNPLYVLHFPGTGIKGHEYIVEENLDRKITISNNISIVSIMNESCWTNSPIRTQCENNNVQIYNTAMNEVRWNNVLKISHILKCLEQINTDYVLIVDGRDTILVNNLDEEFLDKFKQFNCPIVYNGTPIAYPNIRIEPIQELIRIKGKQRYLNAGVCIGRKEALKEFYTKAEEICKSYPNATSEQLIIRKTRLLNPELATWDTENDIFRIIHNCDTKIQSIDDTTLVMI